MGLGDECEYFCAVFNFDDYIDYIGFYSHRNHTASRLNKKPFRLPEFNPVCQKRDLDEIQIVARKPNQRFFANYRRRPTIHYFYKITEK